MAAAVNKQRDNLDAPSLREFARGGRPETQPNETGTLRDMIASHRVEGTPVYRPDGDKIGQVEFLMIDKPSGEVKFIILSFGGFLGLGENHRPVPWEALYYDTDLDGYVVDAKDDVFRNIPILEKYRGSNWDSAYSRQIYQYWGVPF
ncbi:MAG: PRC-barrel domain-containing protein [Pseudomonadota bacterium]